MYPKLTSGLELSVPPAFASPYSAGIIGVGRHALFIKYAVSVLDSFHIVWRFLRMAADFKSHAFSYTASFIKQPRFEGLSDGCLIP